MLRRFNMFDEMFDQLRELDELRRMVGEFRPPALSKRDFLPAVECFSKDKQLVLRAELPGIDPKDVDITVAGGQLILRGEKKDERKVEDKDMLLREISRGSFERSFTLPEGVMVDQVKASFTNGVLEITLPAGKLDSARKVPIEITEGGKKVVKAA